MDLDKIGEVRNYYILGLKNNGSWGIVSYLGTLTLYEANKKFLTLNTCQHHCDALVVADEETYKGLVLDKQSEKRVKQELVEVQDIVQKILH